MFTFGKSNLLNLEKSLIEILKEYENEVEVISKNTSNANYNLYENEYYAFLEIELPGFNKDEIKSELKDDILSITAISLNKSDTETTETSEKKYEYIKKSFYKNDKKLKLSLRKDIAYGDWSASLDKGILKYTIKKDKPKDDTTYIKID